MYTCMFTYVYAYLGGSFRGKKGNAKFHCVGMPWARVLIRQRGVKSSDHPASLGSSGEGGRGRLRLGRPRRSSKWSHKTALSFELALCTFCTCGMFNNETLNIRSYTQIYVYAGVCVHVCIFICACTLFMWTHKYNHLHWQKVCAQLPSVTEAARPGCAAQAGTGPSAPLPPLKGAVLPGRAQSAQLGGTALLKVGLGSRVCRGAGWAPQCSSRVLRSLIPPPVLPRRCTSDSPPAADPPRSVLPFRLGDSRVWGLRNSAAFLPRK